MNPQLTPTTLAANGSFSSLASSIVNVGVTTKAFVVAHALGTAFASGAIVGMLAYHQLRKQSKKDTQEAAT